MAPLIYRKAGLPRRAGRRPGRPQKTECRCTTSNVLISRSSARPSAGAQYSLRRKGQGKYRTRTPSRVIGISIGSGLVPGSRSVNVRGEDMNFVSPPRQSLTEAMNRKDRPSGAHGRQVGRNDVEDPHRLTVQLVAPPAQPALTNDG
jgi:hypothetical protein